MIITKSRPPLSQACMSAVWPHYINLTIHIHSVRTWLRGRGRNKTTVLKLLENLVNYHSETHTLEEIAVSSLPHWCFHDVLSMLIFCPSPSGIFMRKLKIHTKTSGWKCTCCVSSQWHWHCLNQCQEPRSKILHFLFLMLSYLRN